MCAGASKTAGLQRERAGRPPERWHGRAVTDEVPRRQRPVTQGTGERGTAFFAAYLANRNFGARPRCGRAASFGRFAPVCRRRWGAARKVGGARRTGICNVVPQSLPLWALEPPEGEGSLRHSRHKETPRLNQRCTTDSSAGFRRQKGVSKWDEVYRASVQERLPPAQLAAAIGVWAFALAQTPAAWISGGGRMENVRGSECLRRSRQHPGYSGFVSQ